MTDTLKVSILFEELRLAHKAGLPYEDGKWKELRACLAAVPAVVVDPAEIHLYRGGCPNCDKPGTEICTICEEPICEDCLRLHLNDHAAEDRDARQTEAGLRDWGKI